MKPYNERRKSPRGEKEMRPMGEAACRPPLSGGVRLQVVGRIARRFSARKKAGARALTPSRSCSVLMRKRARARGRAPTFPHLPPRPPAQIGDRGFVKARRVGGKNGNVKRDLVKRIYRDVLTPLRRGRESTARTLGSEWMPLLFNRPELLRPAALVRSFLPRRFSRLLIDPEG